MDLLVKWHVNSILEQVSEIFKNKILFKWLIHFIKMNKLIKFDVKKKTFD